MERLTIEKIKSLKEAMRSNMNVYFYDDVMKVFDELLEKRNAEEQGLLLRLPCRLGDIIDRIISHNEIVTLMFETEVCSFRGLQHFWHGMAWNIPKEYLELPFVKIHGVVPDKITEADTIWIEVRKEAYLEIANGYSVSDLQSDSDKVACVASKFRQTVLDKLRTSAE